MPESTAFDVIVIESGAGGRGTLTHRLAPPHSGVLVG
jgi:hypothetical protein